MTSRQVGECFGIKIANTSGTAVKCIGTRQMTWTVGMTQLIMVKQGVVSTPTPAYIELAPVSSSTIELNAMVLHVHDAGYLRTGSMRRRATKGYIIKQAKYNGCCMHCAGGERRAASN